MGFEPTTSSLGMGGGSDLTSEVAGTYDLVDPSLVSCLVLLCRHPSLVRLVEAWPRLSSDQKQQLHKWVFAEKPGG
jgi:hypothetical protein